MVKNEDPYTFVFPIDGEKLPLNLTMTHSPRTDKGSDLIELYFDGLFDVKGAKYHYGSDISDYPPRL